MAHTIINLTMPQDWHELTDKQLLFFYKLAVSEFDTATLQTLCLLRWSGTKVLGRDNRGNFLLKHKKIQFVSSAQDIAELLPQLDWLGKLPSIPVRPSRLHRRTALPADFQGVAFETYIVVDNLYQGYITTRQDSLLDEMASVLYPGLKASLAPHERVAVFYWVASLKDFFARRYPDFLQPAATQSSENLLASSSAVDVEDAMNAQIRALTKGDITKESEILALDSWRALTELNAQAREYKELNSKLSR